MAQNISLWGASYSDVPAVQLPKTGGGTASFTDVTSTTAAAEDVASGKYFFTAQGVLTVGTASGGGGGSMSIVDTLDTHGGTIRTINGDVSYTRRQISAQQTFSPDSSRRATISVLEGFTPGEFYIVTLDNVQYAVSCKLLWSVDYVIGDPNYFFNTITDYTIPFGIAWETGSEATIAVNDTSQHTVKIEHLELDDGGVTLTTKAIASNGTYNAEDDNADGYSSVTVNVPGGQPTLQAKTNISPTTSSQTITADAGYDGLSSIQINAMPSGSATAPASISGTSATVSTGTNTLTLSKTVSVTPSVTAGYISSGTAGNSSVSLTASVTTKGATTYNTSSSDQTIASGTYLTGTQTIRGVTTSNLTAANIKQGVTVTVGDSADADRVLSVTGTYSGGSSSKAIYMYKGLASRTANSYGSTNATVTVTKAGTYTISYVAIRGSSSGTMGTNLHIGSTSGTNQQTWNNGTYGQYVTLTNQTISANTAVTIYATSGSNSRTIYVGQLIVEEQ